MQFYIELHYKDQTPFTTYVTTTVTNERNARKYCLESIEETAASVGRIGKPIKRKATRI